MSDAVKIGIGGDICVAPSHLEQWRQHSDREMLAPIRQISEECDVFIANLETPFTRSNARISKVGPHFRADPEAVGLLLEAGISAMALANNHIKDFGTQGVIDTIKALDNAEIGYFGAGITLAEARRPLELQIKSMRIAVFSLSNQEFSLASEKASGAAPFEPVSCIRWLLSNRHDYDHVIFLIHDGVELSHYPSPRLRIAALALAEAGASAVIFNHSHVLGAHESHDGVPIIWGMGSLLWDLSRGKSPMQSELVRGLVLVLSCSVDGTVTVESRFVRQDSDSALVRWATSDEAVTDETDIRNWSQHLKTGQVVGERRRFLKQREACYLDALRGTPKLWRRIRKRLGLPVRKPSFHERTELLNLLRYHVHRDSIIDILENHLCVEEETK